MRSRRATHDRRQQQRHRTGFFRRQDQSASRVVRFIAIDQRRRQRRVSLPGDEHRNRKLQRPPGRHHRQQTDQPRARGAIPGEQHTRAGFSLGVARHGARPGRMIKGVRLDGPIGQIGPSCLRHREQIDDLNGIVARRDRAVGRCAGQTPLPSAPMIDDRHNVPRTPNTLGPHTGQLPLRRRKGGRRHGRRWQTRLKPRYRHRLELR